MFKFKRALVVCPHTDDGELGCGGTIAKMLEEGVEVYYAAFSACEKSSREKDLPEDILRKEVNHALDVLGIPSENRFLYDFENRVFPQNRHQIFNITLKEITPSQAQPIGDDRSTAQLKKTPVFSFRFMILRQRKRIIGNAVLQDLRQIRMGFWDFPEFVLRYPV